MQVVEEYEARMMLSQLTIIQAANLDEDKVTLLTDIFMADVRFLALNLSLSLLHEYISVGQYGPAVELADDVLKAYKGHMETGEGETWPTGTRNRELTEVDTLIVLGDVQECKSEAMEQACRQTQADVDRDVNKDEEVISKLYDDLWQAGMYKISIYFSLSCVVCMCLVAVCLAFVVCWPLAQFDGSPLSVCLSPVLTLQPSSTSSKSTAFRPRLY